jgi:hypothetical protein
VPTLPNPLSVYVAIFGSPAAPPPEAIITPFPTS